MNGPEHYRLAEALLECATEMSRPTVGGEDPDWDEVAVHTDLADVHARLAQVAATIDVAQAWADAGATEAWRDVTGAPG